MAEGKAQVADLAAPKVIRLKLDETDFAELVKGKIVCVPTGTGRGESPVVVEIALDDIGFTVMEALLNEARDS